MSMLKHHSVKKHDEYLIIFADLANSLISHMVNKATRECGFLDLIIANTNVVSYGN